MEKLQEIHRDLEFYLDLSNEVEPVSQEIRLALFRVYQQCINNILQHAQAHRVNIQFRIEEGKAHLNVEDDGVGFTPPDNLITLLRQGQYGLAGIAERVHALGGKMELISQPGGGTRIIVDIPR